MAYALLFAQFFSASAGPDHNPGECRQSRKRWLLIQAHGRGCGRRTGIQWIRLWLQGAQLYYACASSVLSHNDAAQSRRAAVVCSIVTAPRIVTCFTKWSFKCFTATLWTSNSALISKAACRINPRSYLCMQHLQFWRRRQADAHIHVCTA